MAAKVQSGFQAKDIVKYNAGPAPLQKCVGDFCCVNFGGFCRGFSWRFFLFCALFPSKMRRTNPATKSAKNPAVQKSKSAKNPFRLNPTLINALMVVFAYCWTLRQALFARDVGTARGLERPRCPDNPYPLN